VVGTRRAGPNTRSELVLSLVQLEFDHAKSAPIPAQTLLITLDLATPPANAFDSDASAGTDDHSPGKVNQI
jgi:hypothetical protein